MNSLEIVNRNIKAIKKLLYNLKDVQEGTKEDFDKYYHEQELKEQEQIKQDLEVLEILRVRVFGEDEYSVSGKCIVVEDNFRDLCHIFFKDDEMGKVKQWLEEHNEEESL